MKKKKKKSVEKMMKQIKNLILKYKEFILYVVFGVLTTLVNYVVYFVSTKAFGLDFRVATVIAWVVAVAFAYITNRIWVFESKHDGGKELSKEVTLFICFRLFSLGLELIIMNIGMTKLHAGDFTVMLFEKTLPMGEFITKTIAQIVIIISNFVFSKLIIFKTKD